MERKVCASCGGMIKFSPQDKALKCESCASVYPIEFKNQVVKHRVGVMPDNVNLNEWSNQNRSYKCKMCGAQVTFNKYDIVNQCQYCHSSSLEHLKELPGMKPEKIIPFKINKEQASQEFKTRTKKRWFLPNDFKKNLPKTEMSSSYLSAFNFDGFVSATYRGTRSYTQTVRDRDGGSKRITRYENFSGKIDQQYYDVVVEASDKINQDEIVGILPYDFSECYDFDNDFIKGYNVAYYNQNINQAEEVAKKDMLDDIDRQIRRKYSSIESLTINPTYSNLEYNYTLLPTYFVTYKYKDKSYINIMNGQTGKVSGKVPRSGFKITLFTLFIMLIVGLPILWIAFTM